MFKMENVSIRFSSDWLETMRENCTDKNESMQIGIENQETKSGISIDRILKNGY